MTNSKFSGQKCYKCDLQIPSLGKSEPLSFSICQREYIGLDLTEIKQNDLIINLTPENR